MRRLTQVYSWLDSRLQLEGPIKDAALHKVPRNTASWWYVFGSAAFTLLMLQILTGILLALVYIPSAGEAWNSLNVLNHQLTLGWFLRAMHGWGSNFMVAVVLIHMAQVFLFGAYKLGGPIIAGATLSRFFAFHVFVIPGTLLAFAGLHVWMVLKLGINEWPMPGRIVRRSSYVEEYNALAHERGIPFVPGALWKDVVFSGAILAAVAICAAVFGPFGPGGQPDPTIIQTAPKPDFFFLWLYAALSYLPPSLETPFLLTVPLLAVAGLIALPFYASEGEKSWHRRPVAVLMLTSIAVSWAVLTHLGTYTPWSPKMNAWSGGPTVPTRYVRDASPLQRQGAVVFQSKQCRNCHSIGGVGGERGPALDLIATRMTEDQMIRQVLQGGGNMPAYGKNLPPSEVTALVSF